MKAKIFFLCLLGSALLLGCRERDKHGKILDNPTSGQIKIAVDESLRPLLEAEVDTFVGTYHYASIEVLYTSEEDAMAALMKDSVRLAIITRKLTKEESAMFVQQQIVPHQIKIAKDGVALILHKDNPDSVLQFAQLQSIIEGKITQWKQLNPRSKLSGLEVVFDHPQSGIIRFLNDSIRHVDKMPQNFYAVNNNKSVIDYVSKKPSALGLIGVSWISDRDDSSTSQFLKTIRVARIGRTGKAVQPYQAYIADGQYPLRRDVFIISREARAGLGSGFTAFVAGEKGQRIVLKSGMVPATMPIRIVVINKNNFQ